MLPSAGLLMYRNDPELRVLLVYPGGPFYTKKNNAWWMLPKGQANPGENLQHAAIREFEEETGIKVPAKANLIELGSIRQKGGKIVYAWAFESLAQEVFISSLEFELEWPPHSGKIQKFPEVEKAEFFEISVAKKKILSSQLEFLLRLEQKLNELK